jgi:hypothetical protein
VPIYSQFKGSAIDDGQCISRRVVSTVTDLSKEINGVNTVVVWERDYTEGEEVEAELAKARAGALELEKHAYQIKEYYRKTQPAKPTL